MKAMMFVETAKSTGSVMSFTPRIAASRRGTPLGDFVENIFAHDDGVIHHDSERHNKTKERNHVDARPGEREQSDRAKDRYRNPDSGPERHPQFEHQSEREQHQEKTRSAIGKQKLHALLEFDRTIAREADVDRLRQILLLAASWRAPLAMRGLLAT
jgi:hypothetical protein